MKTTIERQDKMNNKIKIEGFKDAFYAALRAKGLIEEGTEIYDGQILENMNKFALIGCDAFRVPVHVVESGRSLPINVGDEDYGVKQHCSIIGVTAGSVALFAEPKYEPAYRGQPERRHSFLWILVKDIEAYNDSLEQVKVEEVDDRKDVGTFPPAKENIAKAIADKPHGNSRKSQTNGNAVPVEPFPSVALNPVAKAEAMNVAEVKAARVVNKGKSVETISAGDMPLPEPNKVTPRETPPAKRAPKLRLAKAHN